MDCFFFCPSLTGLIICTSRRRRICIPTSLLCNAIFVARRSHEIWSPENHTNFWVARKSHHFWVAQQSHKFSGSNYSRTNFWVSVWSDGLLGRPTVAQFLGSHYGLIRGSWVARWSDQRAKSGKWADQSGLGSRT